jgi:mono/diheme cytochrome c family protein
MQTRLFVALLSAAGLLTAQSVPQVKKTPMTVTSPASGKDMYLHYCASCHGKEGKGDGPAAAALKSAPTNLTELAATAHGKFPDAQVAHVIEGSDNVPAHGSVEMPVWGDVFRQMDGLGPSTTKLRIANLTAYLQSIQGK